MSNEDRVIGVVVARAGAGAKSRLASVLSTAQRRDLAIAMLQDVLAVCAASRDLQGTLIVADDAVAEHVTRAHVVADPGSDMHAAVRAGIDAACQAGACTAIVLPADIPCVSPTDLRRLLTAVRGHTHAVAIGASRDGRGTNALLLRPPDAIAPSFGEPSLERHAALGRAAGCHTVVLHDLGVALDIDTPEDLAAVAAQPSLPPHTAVFLEVLRTQSRNPRGV